jgi:hypothetical protein
LIAFALNTNANTVTPPVITPLSEEAYIDDIPFSTENIFDSLLDVSLNQEFELTEEAYIQDIPFDTKEVIETSNENIRSYFDLEEESHINDIPFSTEAIVRQ